MKYLKSYKSFRGQEVLNEEILGWLRKKAKQFIDNQRDVYSASKEPSEDERKEQVEELSKIIPEEVFDVIKKEVKKLAQETAQQNSEEELNDSYKIILEELLDEFWRDDKTDDEINAMSDEEYDAYLKELTKDKYFKFYPEDGDWSKGDTEQAEFQKHLLDRGIGVNQDIMIDWKPSAKNIEDKINSLKISDSSKKALKVASMTVFFLLLGSKSYAAAGHGDLHHNDKPEKGDAKHSAGGYGKMDLKSGDDKKTSGDDKKTDDKNKTTTTEQLNVKQLSAADERMADIQKGNLERQGYKVKVIAFKDGKPCSYMDGDDYKIFGIKQDGKVSPDTWIKVLKDKGVDVTYDEKTDKWYHPVVKQDNQTDDSSDGKTKLQDAKDKVVKTFDDWKDRAAKLVSIDSTTKADIKVDLKNLKDKIKDKIDGKTEVDKPGEHTMKKGETLYGIAKEKGIDPTKLMNKYKDGVKPGDKIDFSEFISKSSF